MMKKFSKIDESEQAMTKRKSRRDNTILIAMLVFIGIVSGLATGILLDLHSAPPKVSNSFEKAETVEEATSEVSPMESNCVTGVREVAESPDAVVSEILYKDFPWAGDDHVATEFMKDGFLGTELRVVLVDLPDTPFLCTSLDAKGIKIEVKVTK